MELIKKTIEQVMDKLKTKKGKNASNGLGPALKLALNKEEKRHARLGYVNKGIASITVDSSTWLYHLSLRKTTILSKLHKKNKTIKDIRFRIGDLQ